MVTTKQKELDSIQKTIIKDKITPELSSEATQLVFGDGNSDAEIVFIGEAPGKNEDIQGKPFVGASGKFLNEMLDSVGMKREDVYITNIVKYRPPANRDPSIKEKEAFLPYLQSQLEVIQPKVVVTLGRHSMNCFLPGLQISQIHGQPQQVELSLKQGKDDIMKVLILPLYHPAAALYNPGQRQTLIDDFSIIPNLILES